MSAEPALSYQVRDILVDREESRRLRVLTKMPDRTWLFDLTDRLAWPYWVHTAELTVEIKEQHYKKSRSERRAGSAGKKASARAAEKHAKFAPVLNDVVKLFTPRGRGDAFATLRKAYPKLTRRTFDHAIREWFAGGMTQQAFAPDWHQCGVKAIDITNLATIEFAEAKAHALRVACSVDLIASPAPEALPDSTVEGFPRSRAAPVLPTRYPIDRMTLRVFLYFYEWKLAKSGRSLNDAKIEMHNNVFSIEGADGTLRVLPEGQLPTDRQFTYWFYVLIHHKARRIAVKGEHEFNLTEREMLGDEISKTVFAGSIASGDATIWNISIVSRFAGRRVVGCPVVFRIRCKRTGKLLGIAVTLDSASWIGMAAAIANCLEDKVAFCAKLGLTIKDSDWPARGLPGTLEMDRGETDNHHPEPFIRVTGTTITNLKGARPELKPGVESDWRTLEVRLNGKTPSALIETWEKAQGSTWKLEGSLDIDQFTRLLVIHELDRMKKPRDDVHLDDKMIAAGVVRSPLSMWNYSLEFEGGGLRTFDEDEVKYSLLQRDAGSITEHGVMFRGCFYVADELSEAHAFSAARVLGRKKVGLAFDPRLVSYIYLERIGTEELDEPIVCRLNLKLEHQRAYVGKCFAEVRELQAQDSLNAPIQADEHHRSESETVRAHKELVHEAETQTAGASIGGRSKAQQLRDIPGDRIDERNADAPTRAFTPFVESPAKAAGGEAPKAQAALVPPPGPPVPASAAASLTPSPARSSGPNSRQDAQARAFEALLARTQQRQPTKDKV